jgi:outer membrane lipoprotein-sorting protein
MSVIKDSERLKEELLKRLKYLYPTNVGYGFKNSLVVKDAEERGVKIAAEQLSRYFSTKPQKNTLSENQITWLAFRYGIPLQLSIGVLVIKEDGRPTFEIPPYDEAKALQMLKTLYGN